MKNTWTKENKYSDYMNMRVKKMIGLVDLLRASKIMDLGCGPQNLKKYINNFNVYYPVDALDNSEGVILKDFNKKEFFDKKVDLIFCSGVIEYINDYKWFFSKITENTNHVLLSYHFKENNPVKEDLWVNELYTDELIAEFRKNGFILEYFDESVLWKEQILLFKKKDVKSIRKEEKIDIVNCLRINIKRVLFSSFVVEFLKSKLVRKIFELLNISKINKYYSIIDEHF